MMPLPIRPDDAPADSLFPDFHWEGIRWVFWSPVDGVEFDPPCHGRCVSPLWIDLGKARHLKTIPKASPGSSNISGSSTSKDQHNYQYPVPEVKQRKRHRRKHFENQEPCVMRGVYLKNMKWQAAIKVDKKQIHLGTVGSQEEAARLYDRAAFMCGREPNFELSEAEKQELRKFKWDEFLAMTRSSITSKRLLITSDVAADVDGEPLGEGYCKVYVGKAINPNVRLERPRAFVETVGDALGRYVAWRFCDENSLACHLQKMQVKTLAAELPYPYSNVS
ncbi:hypothetical protein Vadar_017643 [Vaccinium darrowii]|uniref:Uncharacterized protein n=1 Tax=Vaccinium darrowii TaxID=229202 RepID=A0ACB7ZDD7_9ERIC|nr:hypothetical protein Vadar_017643 [Vaccinium darrowii]